MRTLRALSIVGALLLIASACGDDDGETTSDTTATTDASTTTSSAESSTTEAPIETVSLSVYLIDADGHVAVGWVRDVEAPAVAEGVLESLLEGPTADDATLGLDTAIPAGTSLNSVSIDDDATGVVDLSAEFASGGDADSAHQRLAQVVYAMTQFPTVDQVEILVDGEPLTSVGDDAVAVDGALVRADFQFGGTYQGVEDLVLVEVPRPGETIEGTSVEVAGSANTFEATVHLEGTASDGTVLVPEEFTTATSGSGTPGTFAHTLTFPSGTSGDVVVSAYSTSPEDGSRQAVDSVPVTLE